MKLTLFFILVALSIPAMSDNGKYALDSIQFDSATVDEIENGTMIRINLSEVNAVLKVQKWCKAGTIVVIPSEISPPKALCEKQEVRKRHRKVKS